MQNAFLQISLSDIYDNFRLIQKKSHAPYFCAVVKANAYGHGATEVAQLLSPFVHCFAVATVEEGKSLRYGGIVKDILVLSPLSDRQEAEACRLFSLTASVSVRSIPFLVASKKEKLRVHIQVNTGMNRYGFTPDLLEQTLSREQLTQENCIVEGIYSHFFRADNEEYSKRQFDCFLRCATFAEHTLNKRLVKHISATGGVIKDASRSLDMVRIGLGLYGYTPFVCDLPLKHAMSAHAFVSQTGNAYGEGLGYGKGRGAKEYSTVRFGYADGLYENFLSPNGLCMDAFVTEKSLKYGEKICVFDNADLAAKQNGVSNYRVLCSFSERTERRYVD